VVVGRGRLGCLVVACVPSFESLRMALFRGWDRSETIGYAGFLPQLRLLPREKELRGEDRVVYAVMRV